jgi:glycerol-3-phosphate dehydrogenase
MLNIFQITGVASAFAVALLSIPFVSPSSRSQVVASGRGGRLVTVEEMKVGGSGSMPVMDGQEVELEQIEASFVINAAGSASDKVAAMIGDKSFKIKPRIGDYLLLHRDQGYLSNATLFPCPGPLGKGILVQSTLWGNLILGPTARDVHNPEHAAQTPQQIQAQILSACKKLVPGFDPKKIIHGFNGSRAKSDRNDWIIESSAVHNKFINVRFQFGIFISK